MMHIASKCPAGMYIETHQAQGFREIRSIQVCKHIFPTGIL